MLSERETGHLRSRSVSSAFTGTLSLAPDVATRSICTAAARMGVIRVPVTLDVLHGLVVIVAISPAVIRVVLHLSQLAAHVDLLTLQQPVDDVSNLSVSGAYPGRIAAGGLWFGLQPENVSLRGRLKLQHIYATVRFGGRVARGRAIIGNKVAVSWHHDEVQMRSINRSISGPPAKPDKVCVED